MNVAIDVAGDVLRFREANSTLGTTQELFGVAGVPPRISRESFVWNNTKAVRSSIPKVVISFADAWFALSDSELASFQWEYDSGIPGSRIRTSVIGEALVQNSPSVRQAKTVIAVDNFLHEEQQELLLQSLGAAGANDIELLWRPIALALAFMDSAVRGRLRKGDRLLVIDAESSYPEVTCIEISEQEGRLLPLRSTPIQQADPRLPWGGHAIRRRIAEKIASGNTDLAAQLLAGPMAEQFIAFTEARACTEVWYRDGAQHHAISLSSRETREKRDQVMSTVSMGAIRAAVAEQFPGSMAAVLWHGWPFRILGNQGLPQHDEVLPADAVARGADLYGMRLLAGEPAYLDTLPGLYILSHIKEIAANAFFPLVAPTHQPGGTIWRLEPPLTRFDAKMGVSNFTAVVRRSDDPRCRKVVTPIPPPARDTPVLVRAEMRPAHGRARVTIEGQEGYEDVFGERRVVEIDWKTSEPFELPFHYAPAVYPVRGRILDDDDPEGRELLRQLAEHPEMTLDTSVNYHGRELRLWQILTPRSEGDGPTRGLFGSAPVNINPKLIAALADRIDQTVHSQNRVKYHNYLFQHASPNFVEELCGKLAKDSPSFDEDDGYGRMRPSWNWAIAPGRVLHTADQFDLFLRFIVRHTKAGSYTAYPDHSFTQHYLWSVMRCLCYHTDTARVPVNTALKATEILANYMEQAWKDKSHWEFAMAAKQGGIPKQKEKEAKYVLCAILFMLRLRDGRADFLQPGDPLCERLRHAIVETIPKVNYPKKMFAVPMKDRLNDYVLRFLMQTASVEDFKALEGLTTSMA